MNSNFSPFLLSSNDNPINIVSSTKYLGAFIDNKLNFKEHILTLENKIARSVGVLSKVYYNFPLKTLLQLGCQRIRHMVDSPQKIRHVIDSPHNG